MSWRPGLIEITAILLSLHSKTHPRLQSLGAMAGLTFAFVPGVEPTNNRAERALRGAVLWRKGCFGNHSDNGSRFTERILTTVATLRQQDRNIVEYVVAAIKAHRTSQLAPSLLPVATLLKEAA